MHARLCHRRNHAKHFQARSFLLTITRDISQDISNKKGGSFTLRARRAPSRPLLISSQSFPLLLCQFPPRMQLIEIQNGIEHEKVTALSFTAPERVVREEHHVTFFNRHINHCGALRDLVASFE